MKHAPAWTSDFLNLQSNQDKRILAARQNKGIQEPYKSRLPCSVRQMVEQETRNPWAYAMETDPTKIEAKNKVFQMLGRKRFTIFDLDVFNPNYNAFVDTRPRQSRSRPLKTTAPASARSESHSKKSVKTPQPPATARASTSTRRLNSVPPTYPPASLSAQPPPFSARGHSHTRVPAPPLTERGHSRHNKEFVIRKTTKHDNGMTMHLGCDSRDILYPRNKEFKLQHPPQDGHINMDGTGFHLLKLKRENPMAEFVNPIVKARTQQRLKKEENKRLKPPWIAIPAGLPATDPNPLGTIDHLLVLKNRESHRYIMNQ